MEGFGTLETLKKVYILTYQAESLSNCDRRFLKNSSGLIGGYVYSTKERSSRLGRGSRRGSGAVAKA